MSYTCGATFEDITMPEGLESVCIKVHNCYDPIEKLYYSCGFVANAENYPQCLHCTSRPATKQHKTYIIIIFVKPLKILKFTTKKIQNL